MVIQLQLGLEVIQSYKRLSYTPWHAIAELVDNSTQSYINNREELDQAFAATGDHLVVGVVYEAGQGGMLRVSDNAMGMSYPELSNALRVGFPPEVNTGRSQFGMGMKTSACWIGNLWTIRTKRLGDSEEHRVTVDVNTVASGNGELPYETEGGKDPQLHYTVIEIRNHNRVFQGRTLRTIRDFLRSMYRQDLREGLVTIEWRGNPLTWDDNDYQFLKARDGSSYRKQFNFEVNGKSVTGWVGILDRGSRAKAGFSILHANRVIRGWPDSWRPESLYGQLQGSNNLINQRLIGEIHFDGFQVSHTKDDILWLGNEEEEVQNKLKDACNDYAAVAQRTRKRGDDERGPSETETQAALDELERELSSSELADIVSMQVVLPPVAVEQTIKGMTRAVSSRAPTFQTNAANFQTLGFLVSDGSVNDPYVVVDSTDAQRVSVIINTQHPHWSQLQGSEGVLNYLRHCTYDAIAEWQARHQASTVDPDTIKIYKDRLLRVPLEIEMHQAEAEDEAGEG